MNTLINYINFLVIPPLEYNSCGEFLIQGGGWIFLLLATAFISFLVLIREFENHNIEISEMTFKMKIKYFTVSLVVGFLISNAIVVLGYFFVSLAFKI